MDYSVKLLPAPSTQTIILDYIRRAKEEIFFRHLALYASGLLFIILYAVASFTAFPKLFNSSVSTAIPAMNFSNYSSKSSLGTLPLPTVTPLPTSTPIPSMVPIEFIIPKLGIRTEVEVVGQTKNLNMDVPKNASHVAWYLYGAKPGEIGNAVISGHYDTPTGAPAVFYKLKDLVVGDEVIIISEDGVEQTFIVTGKERHPYKMFPNEYVFHSKPGKNVNLITCDGIWDTKNRIYNDRLVVYTTLKENR